MSKGFVIEFSAVTWFSDDGDEHDTVHRFRVLVVDEAITAHVAYAGPFDEGWARIVGDEARASRADISSCSWPAPFHENRVVALAFEGFARKLEGHWKGDVHIDDAPAIPWRGLDNGLTLIDIGTVKREA